MITKRPSSDRRRVLYFRPQGAEGKKFYLNSCDGFTQEKASAKIFPGEQDWRPVVRALAREKVFMSVDPVGWEPDTVSHGEI